jgi:hypothetical protein
MQRSQNCIEQSTVESFHHHGSPATEFFGLLPEAVQVVPSSFRGPRASMLIRLPSFRALPTTHSFGTFLGTLCRTSSRTQTKSSELSSDIAKRAGTREARRSVGDTNSGTTPADHPKRPTRIGKLDRRYRTLSARLPLDMMEDAVKRSERLLFDVFSDADCHVARPVCLWLWIPHRYRILGYRYLCWQLCWRTICRRPSL